MKRRLVFDVESVGLQGEAFAVGYVLLLGEKVVDEAWAYCSYFRSSGTYAGRAWARDNCPWSDKGMAPEDLATYGLPPGEVLLTPAQVQDWFWSVWIEQKGKGAELWADVPWPVEARFLIAAVENDRPPDPFSSDKKTQLPSDRDWEGPYPLFDVRSYCEAAMNQLAEGTLLDEDAISESETGVLLHHPLCDARISAAKMIRAGQILSTTRRVIK